MPPILIAAAVAAVLESEKKSVECRSISILTEKYTAFFGTYSTRCNRYKYFCKRLLLCFGQYCSIEKKIQNLRSLFGLPCLQRSVPTSHHSQPSIFEIFWDVEKCWKTTFWPHSNVVAPVSYSQTNVVETKVGLTRKKWEKKQLLNDVMLMSAWYWRQHLPPPFDLMT